MVEQTIQANGNGKHPAAMTVTCPRCGSRVNITDPDVLSGRKLFTVGHPVREFKHVAGRLRPTLRTCYGMFTLIEGVPKNVIVSAP